MGLLSPRSELEYPYKLIAVTFDIKRFVIKTGFVACAFSPYIIADSILLGVTHDLFDIVMLLLPRNETGRS